MKRLKQFCLFMLVALTSGLCVAQSHITVQPKIGTSTDFIMGDVHKFTFVGSNMQVIERDGKSSPFSLEQLDRVNFSEATTPQVVFTITATDGGSAISGATITLTGYSSEVTNEFGIVFFENVNDGRHEYNISATGYTGSNGYVDVSDGKATVAISLEQENSALNDTKNMKLVIYPNPATHSIHIKSNTSIQHIKMIDISGKQINVVAFIDNTNEYVLDISDLSAGNYYLSVANTDGVHTQHIIKQ